MYINICQLKHSNKMQLTKHTDYAFRVLIYLAGMRQDRTTIQEITDAFNISKTHLMKVVNALANKDWVNATRGKNGGICLGVSADQISLKEVIEYMENNLKPVNCDSPACQIRGMCQLLPILTQAQNAYLDYLADYTIADIVDQKTIIQLNIA